MPISLTKDPKRATALNNIRRIADNWGIPDLRDASGHKIPYNAVIALRTPVLDNLIAMGNPTLPHPTAPLVWGYDLPSHDRMPILAFDPDDDPPLPTDSWCETCESMNCTCY